MASLNVPPPYPQSKFACEFLTPAPLSARTLPLDPRVSCIQESRLFRGLSLAECAEVASRAQERRFTKGQTIFREGGPAQLVFVLVAGRVKMSRLSRFGAEVIFRVEESGDVLGGLALSPDSRHRSTAQCLGQCQVLAWAARNFSALEERIPIVRRNAAVILGDRLHLLDERFVGLATERVAPRPSRRVTVKVLRFPGRPALYRLSWIYLQDSTDVGLFWLMLILIRSVFNPPLVRAADRAISVPPGQHCIELPFRSRSR